MNNLSNIIVAFCNLLFWKFLFCFVLFFSFLSSSAPALYCCWARLQVLRSPGRGRSWPVPHSLWPASEAKQGSETCTWPTQPQGMVQGLEPSERVGGTGWAVCVALCAALSLEGVFWLIINISLFWLNRMRKINFWRCSEFVLVQEIKYLRLIKVK